MSSTSIESLWRNIDNWLKARMPSEWVDMPGLSENEIRQAEDQLCHRLPEDVRESYKIHNGMPFLEIAYLGFFLPLLRPSKEKAQKLGNVLQNWRFMNELYNSGAFQDFEAAPEGPILKQHWSFDWIPIFDNNQGDLHCLDMNPPLGGVVGQIIDWYRSDGPKWIWVNQFKDWLAALSEDLAEDQYHLKIGHFTAYLVKKSVWLEKQAREQEAREHEAKEDHDNDLEALMQALAAAQKNMSKE